MQPNIPIAIVCGLAAALALVAAARVPSVGGALIPLIALPVALAGFVSNAKTSLAATGVAVLLLGVVTGLAPAAFFALTAGLPAALLVHLALLHREGGPGLTLWYPAGPIIVAAALWAASLMAAALVLSSPNGGIERIETFVRSTLDQMLASGFGGLAGDGPLGDDEKAQLAQSMLELLPGTSAAFWMLSLLACLWLAAHIALATGKLVRPWPDLATFTIPAGTPLLLAVALGASYLLDGLARLIALGYAGALLAGFVLAGLAVIHFNTRGLSWRGPALGALYALIVIANTKAVLVLALLGLLDSFSPLRRSAEPGAPPG